MNIGTWSDVTSKVPVVILAGGRGARFDHESQVLPKPLISVAGKPIIQHLIDSLVEQGFREFIIAAGYLGNKFDEHFRTVAKGPFFYANGDLPWRQYGMEYPDAGVKIIVAKIIVADTGQDSHTGERVVRLRPLIGERRFVLTYGDGLSDVPMEKVIELHEKDSKGKLWWGEERPDDTVPALVTITSVRAPARFGAIEFSRLDDWGVGEVRSFQEKPQDSWINGGFMVVEPEFIWKYLEDSDGNYQLETQALPAVAKHGFMRAYKHGAYWRCMDTRRDLEQIEKDVEQAGGTLPWMPKR